MRFISSFASGHKLPSHLVKELISAPACCSGTFVGCFPTVWGTWVSWCLRGGRQTKWSIKPAVEHWVRSPCFWTEGFHSPYGRKAAQPVACLTLNHVLRKLSRLGCDLSSSHCTATFPCKIETLHYVYVSSSKEWKPLTIYYEITLVCTFSLCLFREDKVEENGLNIPAFLKLSKLSLHRQIICMHVMARSKCTGINYSSRCFGDFSPLEFLHNTIKQLAVCPQGQRFIKWNTLQKVWFWVKITPLRWGVLFSDL